MKSSILTLWLLAVLFWPPCIGQQSPNPTELQVYLRALVTYYNQHRTAIKTYDCDVDDINEGNVNLWGTLSTLKYLAGDPSVSRGKPGLIGNNKQKLAVFLAKIGFLKAPGSLVFRNEEVKTLKLEGCQKEGMWTMHGEPEGDSTFHEEGSVKKQAPNRHSYIHVFTCFRLGECSHTFYVITRLSPDLPKDGPQIDGEKRMNNANYEITCSVPFVTVKGITKSNKAVNRRSFPPYKISWKIRKFEHKYGQVRATARRNMAASEYYNRQLNIIVRFGWKITEKDGSTEYRNVDPTDWNDYFGEPATYNRRNFEFHSQILLDGASREDHSGSYECVIEDNNGVISTPDRFVAKENGIDVAWDTYGGKTNVFVVPKLYPIITASILGGLVVLTGIIILACPKKMEYDDGTPYTKAELDHNYDPHENRESKSMDASESTDITASSMTVEKSEITEQSSVQQ